MVEAGRLVRDAARARRLNRAMHELRRPLQAIALSLEARSPDLVGAEACLEQARRRPARARCDGERPAVPARSSRRARITEVLEALDRRWRFADVEVEGPARDRDIEADVDRLGAALDNLVANALRHGSGSFEVERPSPIGRQGRASRSATRARPARRGATRAGAGSAGTATGSTWSPESPRPTAASVAPARRVQGGGTLAAISLPVAGPDPSGPG